MYPKNSASPEPIAIGAVVQISDGAVQTSGCTVRIKPIGVAEGDGGGTTAYSTDGIVLYTPTQAETNYTSFILIAKKASCLPVSVTVVTTESAVAGRVSVGMLAGVVQSLTDLKDFADDGYDPSTNLVQADVARLGASAANLAKLAAIAASAVTGIVEDHASNSTTQFQSDLAETADDYYGGASGGCVLAFTSGTNAGQARRISDYVGASGTITVEAAFDAEPDAGDTFIILGRIEA